MPIAAPTAAPTTRSRSAKPASYEGLSLTMPSWLAAMASITVTIGVAMPSFSPLSTLSPRRIRMGIRLSLMT